MNSRQKRQFPERKRLLPDPDPKIPMPGEFTLA
jgi:hypothetical protein